MVITLHAVAFVLYLTAAGILGVCLGRGRRSVPTAGLGAAGAAVLAHAGALAGYTVGFGELPLVGVAPSLSTLGFLIAAVQVTTTGVRAARPVGLILVPIVAVLLGIALTMGIAPSGEPLAFRGAWFSLHVVLAFVGYAGLIVAFAAGLMYLLQFRTLKGKQFGRMFRFFPSLDALDRLGRQSLAIGFPALSLGLVLAWAWTVRFRQTLAANDPQVIWGMLTWLVFVGVLFARRGEAGSDRRGALASVLGFAVVLVSFIVLRMAMTAGHGFL